MEENNIVDSSNVSTEPSGTTNNLDTPSEDLDLSVFDSPEESPEIDQSINPETLQPYEVLIDGKTKFAIDERFRDTDPITGVYKTIQSSRDQLQHKYNQLMAENAEITPVKEVFEQLLENPNLAKAFIMEKHPDLIPKVDRKTEIKMQLDKEFGPDFRETEFNADEARDDPFSKSADYLARYRELQRTSSKNEQSESFKELLEKFEKEKEEKINANLEMEKKLRADSKMDDAEWADFTNWAKRFIGNPYNLVKTYRFAKRTSKSPRSVTSLGGQGQGGTITNRLNQLFGE